MKPVLIRPGQGSGAIPEIMENTGYRTSAETIKDAGGRRGIMELVGEAVNRYGGGSAYRTAMDYATLRSSLAP